MNPLYEFPKERVPFPARPNHPGRPDHVVGRASDHHGLQWSGLAAFESREDREEAVRTLRELGFNYATTYTDISYGPARPAVSWGRFLPSTLRPSVRERLERARAKNRAARYPA